LPTELLNKIFANFPDTSSVSSSELHFFLKKEFPDLADKTISWKINQMKAQGILSHLGRGLYALEKKREYIPELSSYLKRIYKKVKKELPFVDLCIWDSRWLNEFMTQQMFRYYIVVETEKDATDAVFNVLTSFGNNVFLDPDAEIFRRYIVNYQEVIIVRPIISEAPLIEIDTIKVPALEKLLIDSMIDKDIFAAQQDELDNIYETVFQKYFINISKTRRYARRRNQLTEFESKIVKLNLNHSK
jgi:hypothetical protein